MKTLLKIFSLVLLISFITPQKSNAQDIEKSIDARYGRDVDYEVTYHITTKLDGYDEYAYDWIDDQHIGLTYGNAWGIYKGTTNEDTGGWVKIWCEAEDGYTRTKIVYFDVVIAVSFWFKASDWTMNMVPDNQ